MATAEKEAAENIAAFDELEDLIMGYSKSMTVRAVVDLQIPDILARAGGELTVKEIHQMIGGTGPSSVDFLGRLMVYASLLGLFRQVPETSGGVVVDEGRKYGLTRLSTMLLEAESPAPQMSLAHGVRFLIEPLTLQAWCQLFSAVRTGTNAFELSQGMSFWEYWKQNPEFGTAASKAMASGSTAVMRSLLIVYGGFDGVKKLVDVGGGTGASLKYITQAHPQIQGVNFDLPHVVSAAPEIPGVTHVGGSMFESVPEGDAIFMKWIMHDWGDEECVKILQNCLKSIPENGKVIIVDSILPDPEKGTPVAYMKDIRMMAMTDSGRERTATEWRRLLERAGFSRVNVISIPLGVIEGFKS